MQIVCILLHLDNNASKSLVKSLLDDAMPACGPVSGYLSLHLTEVGVLLKQLII